MESSTITWIVAGLLACTVLFLVVWKLFLNKTKRGNALMLLGLTNSGKTTLFFKLKDGKLANTHTSVKENFAKFIPKVGSVEKEVEVVDIPGHSRVRQQLLNQYLPITKKIVYLLDASDFDCRANSEYLYDLFTNRKLIEQFKPVSVTIICNKADLAFFVKNQMKRDLEKELTSIHRTKQHQHQSIDEDTTTAPLPLIEDNREFSFENWSSFRDIPISFEFCSVTREKDEVFDKVMETTLSDL